MIMEDLRNNTHSTAGDTTTVSADNRHENYSDYILENEIDNTDKEIVQIMVIATFPVILIVGTIGNALTFVIMQKGSLKHSSTCFYMAMLAMADTGECLRICSDIASKATHSSFFSKYPTLALLECMRTVRCSGRLWWGVSAQGVWPWGVWSWGCLPRAVSDFWGISAWGWGRPCLPRGCTPPCGQNHSGR